MCERRERNDGHVDLLDPKMDFRKNATQSSAPSSVPYSYSVTYPPHEPLRSQLSEKDVRIPFLENKLLQSIVERIVQICRVVQEINHVDQMTAREVGGTKGHDGCEIEIGTVDLIPR